LPERPVPFDRHVAALDEASFAQTLVERGQQMRAVIRRSGAEKADYRHRRLLPARRDRPRRRAAEQRDERASPHSIELHPLPQPETLWQHTALARIESGLAALRDFNPVVDRSGSRASN
jgi:hypothetical protein